MKNNKPNFLEVKTIEEANNVDLSEYCYDRFSECKQAYLFHRYKKRLGM